MKPSIIVSSSDLERLEGLLTLPAFRSRSDLDGLRAELERADVREPQDMPADVITMNSRARFVEEGTGREYELTLAYPKDANAEAHRVSIFSPAGSALLGLSAGQSIDWKSADGKEIRLKVLESPGNLKPTDSSNCKRSRSVPRLPCGSDASRSSATARRPRARERMPPSQLSNSSQPSRRTLAPSAASFSSRRS